MGAWASPSQIGTSHLSIKGRGSGDRSGNADRNIQCRQTKVIEYIPVNNLYSVLSAMTSRPSLTLSTLATS
jgi:hypothetical protein